MPDDPGLILARHVWGTRFEQLPDEAVAATKLDILDTLGTAIDGSGAPGVGELTKLARRWGGLEESSLLVLGGKLPAPQAALINATMGHALDFDDTFDRAGHIHPGTSVLAASFAAAESIGKVTGWEFLLAVTLGLDVSCRLALAVALAKEGFTGAKDVFTGQYGFFPMYAPEGYDLAGIEEDLGTVFRGVELSFKPYPCGRPTHALIDAAVALHHELELAQFPPTWAKVSVSEAVFQAQFSAAGSNRRPASQVEAQFSLPYLISAALCLGNVGIGEVAVMNNPQVLVLSDTIKGESQAGLSAGRGHVEVGRADGRSSLREATTPSGGPDKPLTDAQLEAKFKDCATHAATNISEREGGQALDFVNGLDKEEDATKLIELVRGN